MTYENEEFYKNCGIDLTYVKDCKDEKITELVTNFLAIESLLNVVARGGFADDAKRVKTLEDKIIDIIKKDARVAMVYKTITGLGRTSSVGTLCLARNLDGVVSWLVENYPSSCHTVDYFGTTLPMECATKGKENLVNRIINCMPQYIIREKDKAGRTMAHFCGEKYNKDSSFSTTLKFLLPKVCPNALFDKDKMGNSVGDYMHGNVIPFEDDFSIVD